MKATELRIGNLVHAELGLPSLNIHVIVAQDISYINRDLCEVYPIQLTEEWLLRFGFNDDGVTFKLNGIHLWFSSYDNCYLLRIYQIGSDIERKINIYFVHQLQNLYFALTGQELEFAKVGE
jgi:hypothetical protein